MGLRGILLRIINILLFIVLAFIGLDVLFQLLRANPGNEVVAFVDRVAGRLLAPFEGMFAEQNFLITALIAVLAYWLVAVVASAIVRMLPAGRGVEAGREDTSRRRWGSRRRVRAEDRH
jgi:hypothetical protein